MQLVQGLLQHLFLDVGVDVGSGLVVRMADNLHSDQRVDAAFVEHGHVVVPEVMRLLNDPKTLFYAFSFPAHSFIAFKNSS